MKKTKNITICLNINTLNKLNEYTKINCINKSALIDKLINDEINKNIK